MDRLSNRTSRLLAKREEEQGPKVIDTKVSEVPGVELGDTFDYLKGRDIEDEYPYLTQGGDRLGISRKAKPQEWTKRELEEKIEAHYQQIEKMVDHIELLEGLRDAHFD